MENTKSQPLEKGLWTFNGINLTLLGHRCTSCGELFFPRRKCSHCAHCFSNTLEEIHLGPEGRIATFSIVMVSPAGGYYHGPVPYAYGCVDLPEGIRIKSLMARGDMDNLEVGMVVTLSTEVLYESGEGVPVETFVFRHLK